jgi:hypothetical protein
MVVSFKILSLLKRPMKKIGSLLCIAALTLASSAVAEEFKISFQGQDGLDRPPLLTVGFETFLDSTKVTASSELKNKDYADHAVEYRFFVNGELYKTLIELRDPTIVTPIAVSIPFTVAPPPYPVTVVATLLYPKRTFTTVGTAVVMDTATVRTLDCTVTDETDTDAKAYVANSVTTRPTADGFGLDFTAKSTSGDDDVHFVGTFTLANGSASGTIKLDQRTFVVTGDNINKNFEELDLSTADGSVSLACS